MSARSYRYAYPRPGLTVDAVVFGFDAGELKVLLIERENPPFAGRWAFPGGYVHMHETLEAAVRRELAEETGVRLAYLEQLYTFGAVKRDPRDRIVSVAYYALVKLSDQRIRAATDARDVAWFPVSKKPPLAFDHDDILRVALARLKGKVRYQPIGFELLPPKFALSEIQHLYETILGTPLDKRNFRRKILAMDLLRERGEVQRDVAHRAARLYRFDKQRYHELTRRGFNFEL
jgi:8-oxo-dGTP diphosphatase